MRAYRVSSGRPIHPFGDPVRECFVGVDSIAAWQESAVLACGLELVDVDTIDRATERPCILFFDDVFFSEMALRQFVAEASSASGNVALAIRDSVALEACAPLSDARQLEDGGRAFDVFHLRTPNAPRDRDELRAFATPCLIDAREWKRRLRLPPSIVETNESWHRTSNEVVAPLTARVVAHVRHWLHLIRLSQLSVGVTLLDRVRRERPRGLLFSAIFRRRDPWAIARKLNFVHPTARIHPTADLECAVVGPGCVVHAHAHVHRSILGANVEVQDHARVVGCTLAERTRVLRASYLALSAAWPGATLSSYKAQLSLFGRDVFLTTSALLIDAKLEGEVRIEHEGKFVHSGTPFLGVCLGHRVTLGAHVTVQAGRAIPNGLTIIAPEELTVSQAGAFPEGTLVTVRNGRLEPV